LEAAAGARSIRCTRLLPYSVMRRCRREEGDAVGVAELAEGIAGSVGGADPGDELPVEVKRPMRWLRESVTTSSVGSPVAPLAMAMDWGRLNSILRRIRRWSQRRQRKRGTWRRRRRRRCGRCRRIR